MTQKINLADITISHNPRRPFPLLQDNLETEGYGNYTLLQLIAELAMGNDEQKKEFCRLIETYDDKSPEGILSLAHSRADAEIQPIVVRDFRAKVGEIYITRYGVVVGERRCLACAYNHAKLGLKAEIGAEVKKMTVTEAFDWAVAENLQRKNLNDLEHGRIFATYRQQINPATGQKWSLKEIALHLNVDYQFVRGREALTYLPEKEQNRLETGKVNVTKAIQRGLALKSGKNADEELQDKKVNRMRTLNVNETNALFDAKRAANASPDYLSALADVLQITLSEAIRASKQREREAKKVA